MEWSGYHISCSPPLREATSGFRTGGAGRPLVLGRHRLRKQTRFFCRNMIQCCWWSLWTAFILKGKSSHSTIGSELGKLRQGTFHRNDQKLVKFSEKPAARLQLSVTTSPQVFSLTGRPVDFTGKHCLNSERSPHLLGCSCGPYFGQNWILKWNSVKIAY